jgi:hypothetical protein
MAEEQQKKSGDSEAAKPTGPAGAADAAADNEDTAENGPTGGKEGGEGYAGAGGNTGGISSPEGVIVMTAAVVFDILGLIPLVNIASDIIAIIVFGLWLFISQRGKALASFVIALILELIPIVSDIAPFVSLFSGGKLPASWVGFAWKTLGGTSGTADEKSGENKEGGGESGAAKGAVSAAAGKAA